MMRALGCGPLRRRAPSLHAPHVFSANIFSANPMVKQGWERQGLVKPAGLLVITAELGVSWALHVPRFLMLYNRNDKKRNRTEFVRSKLVYKGYKTTY